MIKINEKFINLIPPLQKRERELLEASILAEGCRDALILWNGYIVDGHNRYAICEEHGIDFDTFEKEFDSEDDAMLWMLDTQAGRRNLTDGWRWDLKLKKREILLRQGKEKQKETLGGFKYEPSVLSNNDKTDKHNTQAKVADELGWSTGKTAQAQYVWKHAEPEVIEDVKRGEMSIHRAYQETKKPHVSNNSGENEWYTPLEYIESARAVLGSIDTDPASSETANKTVQAKTYYTKENNGLEKEWRGNVWMNPPYSSELIGKFVDKLCHHVNSRSVENAIVLVNNATETGWFGNLVSISNAVCFPRKRIKFIDQNGNESGAPLQGQAVLYSGDNPQKFIDNFSQFGWCALCVEK
jgi:phage N-6-adenine-methyltransferase